MRQVVLGALFGFLAALSAVSYFGSGPRPSAPVEVSPVRALGVASPVRAPLPMRTLKNLPIQVPYISPDAGR